MSWCGAVDQDDAGMMADLEQRQTQVAFLRAPVRSEWHVASHAQRVVRSDRCAVRGTARWCSEVVAVWCSEGDAVADVPLMSGERSGQHVRLQ